MMVAAVVIVASLVVGVAAGGSMTGIRNAHLHSVLGCAVVLVAARVVGSLGQGAVAFALAVVAMLAFVLLNRGSHGASPLAAGVLMNWWTILLGGGMTVSLQAITVLGSVPARTDSLHRVSLSGEPANLLSDILPIPSPVTAVLSLGDVLIFVGISALIIQWMLSSEQLGRSDGGKAEAVG